MATPGAIRAGQGEIELGLNQSPLKQGLADAKAELEAFGRGVASIGAMIANVGAQITAPFLRGVEAFAELGGSIYRASQQTGIGFESMGRLAAATGGNVEMATRNIMQMDRFLQGVASGSHTHAVALDRLGLSFEQLNTASQHERLLLFADALNNVGDAGQRAALRREIFGRSFGRGGTGTLNLEGGRAGILEREQRAQELGGVLSPADVDLAHQYTESQRELGLAGRGMWAALGAAATPVMIEVAKFWTEVFVNVRYVVEGIRGFLTEVFRIADYVNKAGLALMYLGAAISGAGVAFSVLSGAIAASPIVLIVGAILLAARALGFEFSLLHTQLGFVDSALDAVLSPIYAVKDAIVAAWGAFVQYLHDNGLIEFTQRLLRAVAVVAGGVAVLVAATLAAKYFVAALLIGWAAIPLYDKIFFVLDRIHTLMLIGVIPTGPLYPLVLVYEALGNILRLIDLVRAAWYAWVLVIEPMLGPLAPLLTSWMMIPTLIVAAAAALGVWAAYIHESVVGEFLVSLVRTTAQFVLIGAVIIAAAGYITYLAVRWVYASGVIGSAFRDISEVVTTGLNSLIAVLQAIWDAIAPVVRFTVYILAGAAAILLIAGYLAYLGIAFADLRVLVSLVIYGIQGAWLLLMFSVKAALDIVIFSLKAFLAIVVFSARAFLTFLEWGTPIGIIMDLGKALLYLAGVLLDSLVAGFWKLLSVAGIAFGYLGSAIANMASTFAAAFISTAAGFMQMFNGIVRAATIAWGGITAAFSIGDWQTIWTIIQLTAQIAWERLSYFAVSTFWTWRDALVDVFSGLWAAMRAGFFRVWQEIRAIGFESLAEIAEATIRNTPTEAARRLLREQLNPEGLRQQARVARIAGEIGAEVRIQEGMPTPAEMAMRGVRAVDLAIRNQGDVGRLEAELAQVARVAQTIAAATQGVNAVNAAVRAQLADAGGPGFVGAAKIVSQGTFSAQAAFGMLGGRSESAESRQARMHQEQIAELQRQNAILAQILQRVGVRFG